jgi:hypothetical protein
LNPTLLCLYNAASVRRSLRPPALSYVPLSDMSDANA